MNGIAARRRARGDWPVFASAVLLLAAALLLHRHFFHDDAYITLRYVARWLGGRGLGWNDGERVEGFSSPAWLAQLALLGRLGLDLPLAARALGLLYALGTVVLWYRARAEPAGLLALVTVPGFAMWTWGGLETLGACFWMLLSLDLVWRAREAPFALAPALRLAGALTVVALGRPEGIVVALAILGAGWRNRSKATLAMAALLVGLGFASYEGFRLLYFGDFIANAARAKTLGLPCGARLESAAVYLGKTSPQWLGAILVSAWLLASRARRREVAWLLLPILPLLGVVFLGGGDHMPGARLLVGVVAVACFATSLGAPLPRKTVPSLTLALAALAAFWQLQLTCRYPAAPNPAATIGEVVGTWLERRLPAGSLVASASAGSLPYFAPSLAFVDTLGLNDGHIARQTPAPLPRGLDNPDAWTEVPGHVRGDGAYVLGRRPDVVLLGGANGALEPWFLGDYQMIMAKAFQTDYAPWLFLVEVPPHARAWIADELDETGARLPITLYLRHGSHAGSLAAAQGSPLPPPWVRR